MCRDLTRWNSLRSKKDENWYFPMITVCTTLVAHTHHYFQLSMTEKSLCFEGVMHINLKWFEDFHPALLKTPKIRPIKKSLTIARGQTGHLKSFKGLPHHDFWNFPMPWQPQRLLETYQTFVKIFLKRPFRNFLKNLRCLQDPLRRKM